MAEFTAIETQEAFDAAIKDRIERAQASVRQEYEGFDEYKTKAEDYDTKMADFQEQLSDRDTRIAELQQKLTTYETDSAKTRLVNEFNLPAGSEEFLSGADEGAWRAQAKKLAAMTTKSYPRKNYTEPADEKTVSLRKMLKELRGD